MLQQILPSQAGTQDLGSPVPSRMVWNGCPPTGGSWFNDAGRRHRFQWLQGVLTNMIRDFREKSCERASNLVIVLRSKEFAVGGRGACGTGTTLASFYYGVVLPW
jgi:hypothetical protein